MTESPIEDHSSHYEDDKQLSEYAEFHYGDTYYGVPNFPKALSELAIKVMQGQPMRMALDLGCATGRATFELAAGEGFGERNPDMQQWVSKSLLKELGDPLEQYAVGDVVQFPAPNGQGSFAGAVQQVSDDAVLFDFNHPLAGQPVTFEVQVIGIL
jgi:SAM-dependent methyltransferase